MESVQFSCSVMSSSLWSHELQHARLSCPSPTPRACWKLMFIEWVIPSNHLFLCHTLLLPPSIFPRIRVFSSESVLCIRWPKYWSLSFSISPSVRELCNFLSSISSQQKFEVTAVKTLGGSQLVSQLLDRSVLQISDRSVLQLRVTAQFYLENKGKYILKAWRHANPKDLKRREREGAGKHGREGERERGRQAEREWGTEGERQKGREGERQRGRETPSPLAPLSVCFFFLFPLGLSYVSWASQECCFFTWSPQSDPQNLLCSIFMDFSLTCLLATTILDSFAPF